MGRRRKKSAVNEVNLTIKYFLFGFNVFFWFTGLLMLIVGLWALSEKGHINSIKNVTFLPVDPISAILSVSAVTFFVSFLGCVGSLRENLSLLQFFYVFLGLLFLTELSLAITGFASSSWMEQQFSLFVNSTIQYYKEDSDLQGLIDFTQIYLGCCGGMNGPSDWENNIYFNCSSRVFINEISFSPIQACGVPFSCCLSDVNAVENAQCGFGVRKLNLIAQANLIHTKGCILLFEEWIRAHLFSIASFLMILAIMQGVQLILSYKMIADIEIILLKQGVLQSDKVPYQDGDLSEAVSLV